MPQCWCWVLGDWKMPSVINLMPTDFVSYLFLKLGSGSAKQAKLNPSVSGLFCDCVRPGAQRVFHILWAVGEMYKSSLYSRPLYQLLLLVLLGEQGKSYSTQLLSLSCFFFPVNAKLYVILQNGKLEICKNCKVLEQNWEILMPNWLSISQAC